MHVGIGILAHFLENVRFLVHIKLVNISEADKDKEVWFLLLYTDQKTFYIIPWQAIQLMFSTLYVKQQNQFLILQSWIT